MIVNIRGTSGTGKSTLVRTALEMLRPFVTEHHIPGRRQPYYYTAERPGRASIAVVGGYACECGGCDTIKTRPETFELIRRLHVDGHHVVFEGLLLSQESNYIIGLHRDGLPVTAIDIELPLDVCIGAVNERRRRKNPAAPPVNPKGTTDKYRQGKNARAKMVAAGMSVVLVTSREAAWDALKELLGL